MLASWGRGGVQLAEGSEYDIAGTPCETLDRRRPRRAPERHARAPSRATRFVARHGLEGYLAIVLRGARRRRASATSA